MRHLVKVSLFLLIPLLGYSTEDQAKLKQETEKKVETGKPSVPKKISKQNIETRSQKSINRITLNKTNQIIDQMKNSDPRGGSHMSLRLGAIQILSNTTGLETSPDKSLLATGFDLVFPVWGDLYLEARYAKHTNTLSPSNLSTDDSLSLSNLNQTSTDVGLKYRFVLDETQPSNYLGLKLLVHNTTNNFVLADPSASIIINQYDGIVLGVEKGIPITSNLGIDASLDAISINSVKESSSFAVKASGVGFVVRGEVYLTFDVFGQRLRAAMAYWQSGMVNEFVAADRELFDRQNQVQTYRMISGSFGFAF